MVTLEKNIFTNYHPHSPFEFVWRLKPCACQLYKERKNVIPFPKEFMIQIQTRVGGSGEGTGRQAVVSVHWQANLCQGIL